MVLPRGKEVVEEHEGSTAILTKGLESSGRLGRMDDDSDRRREAKGLGELDSGSSETRPEAAGNVPQSPTEVIWGSGSPGTGGRQGIAAVGNSPEKNTDGGIGAQQSVGEPVGGSGGKKMSWRCSGCLL